MTSFLGYSTGNKSVYEECKHAAFGRIHDLFTCLHTSVKTVKPPMSCSPVGENPSLVRKVKRRMASLVHADRKFTTAQNITLYKSVVQKGISEHTTHRQISERGILTTHQNQETRRWNNSLLCGGETTIPMGKSKLLMLKSVCYPSGVDPRQELLVSVKGKVQYWCTKFRITKMMIFYLIPHTLVKTKILVFNIILEIIFGHLNRL